MIGIGFDSGERTAGERPLAVVPGRSVCSAPWFIDASSWRARPRPVPPIVSAFANMSDMPSAPLSSTMCSTLPNAEAPASTICGQFSASCWATTASWFSASAAARALIASASARPWAFADSAWASPLACVAAASASPVARVAVAAARPWASVAWASAAAAVFTRVASAAAASSVSFALACAAEMRASRSASASVLFS